MISIRELLARLELRRCARIGRSPAVRGRVFVLGPGSVQLGDGVVLDAAWAPIELKTFDARSQIVLGDGVRVESGTSIESVASVRIGARARLGAFSKVMDNHFHPLSGDRHARPSSDPVEIGEEARIGDRAVVLAGARIGARAVVRAGTVVGRRLPVPEGAVASGSPARLEPAG
jgi:acetyltransferase-like isoleucine patch superfamily enzyme